MAQFSAASGQQGLAGLVAAQVEAATQARSSQQGHGSLSPDVSELAALLEAFNLHTDQVGAACLFQ